MESTLYGFEDYRMLRINEDFLDPGWVKYGRDSVRISDFRYGIWLFKKDVPMVKDANRMNRINTEAVINHKELLDTAKKVYVHKNCSISRTLLSSKYKKVLDPWMADVVVVPKIAESEVNYWSRDSEVVIFCNEDTKTLVARMYSDSYPDVTDRVFLKATEDTKLGDIVPSNYSFLTGYGTYVSTEVIEGLRDATFMYKGAIIEFSPKEEYLIDIFTNNIPSDRIVFEDSVQDSLASEDNKITLESLLSIYDMLESKDMDTVNAGLKALAMMDYVHYANSVIYMLNQVTSSNFRWCKAFTSTAVKFMFKSLAFGRRVRSNMSFFCSSDIYPEDFEVYKQLVQHFDKTSTPMEKLRYANFMTTTEEGILTPRFKVTA